MRAKLEDIVEKVAEFVKNESSCLERIDFVVGVSRGGLVPAVLVSTAIDKPLVAAYIDRRDRTYLDRGDWIRGKRLLLVDDIVRTGSTFRKMEKLLKAYEPESVQSYTLFCLKGASACPTWTDLVDMDVVLPWDV